MDDKQIVDLYWRRDEKAIVNTQKKYGSLLLGIANSVLSNMLDAEETVNDTYIRVWNAIPDDRPEYLKPYLAKITRRLSIDLFRKQKAKKRGSGEYEASLEELDEAVTSGENPADEAEAKALSETIDLFLEQLDEKTRDVFVKRYFYFLSVKKIASQLDLTQNNVTVILFRTRQKLKEHLLKEGY